MPAIQVQRARPRKPVRHDPKPRHIDGTTPLMRLKNRRKGYTYRAAAINEPYFGLPYYKSRGWEVVIYEKGGVCFEGGQSCTEGSPLEQMGHVIVCMTEDQAAQLEQYGDDGNSGQEEADRIEAQIIDRESGMRDLIRGLGGPQYFQTQNKTRAPEPESGEVEGEF